MTRKFFAYFHVSHAHTIYYQLPLVDAVQHGWAVFGGTGGTMGEKDWIHMNAVSYDPQRDQVVMSFNVPSEIVLGACRIHSHPSVSS